MRFVSSLWAALSVPVVPVVLAVLAVLVGLPPLAGTAQAQQIKPRFLLIADNSGSMELGSLGSTTCTGYATNRMGHAKCAIRNILDSAGDAEFGLMRFAISGADCSNTCADRYQGGALSGNNCGGDLVVPISDDNDDAREWVDGNCVATSCTGNWQDNQKELYAKAWTPLYESLYEARDYFQGSLSGIDAPTEFDAAAACRPLNVILLTDGTQQGCASGVDPQDAAAALRNLTVPSPDGNITKDVRTYVIGFGVSDPTTQIENIASQGGTDAYYADDQDTLSAALQQIIFDAQLSESCDGTDEDCDGVIDEGWDLWCDPLANRTQQPALAARYTSEGNPGGEPALGEAEANQWLCTEPTEACNQLDDDCDGIVDEDASGGVEVCGGVDDDCDGIIDEGISCSCAPSEICNGINDDCNDGTLDTDLTRPCGTDEGICETGIESCQDLGGGSWGYGGCDAEVADPAGESCNGLDDDCDGIEDSFTESCGDSGVGECVLGQRLCTGGSWGACVGDIGPGDEICDGLDNDCDGNTDEDVDGMGAPLPDGVSVNDPRLGVDCGTNQGTCGYGSTICSGGGVVCYGEDLGDGAEVCDGEDDDCDGLTDEGNPGGGGQCGSSDQGDCQYGAEQCIGGSLVCVGNIEPGERAESCDGADNDCDSSVDESLSRTCGTDEGVCQVGSQACSAGAWGACSEDTDGDPETCDGEDDDCDGKVDEEVTDDGGACGSGQGECSLGFEVCVGGALTCAGDIGASAETCDNLDNDCDGRTDEGVAARACGTTVGECVLGTQACSAGAWGTCSEDSAGTAEICDGLDNDCDGAFDEGTLAGVGAACGGGLGACTPGAQQCVAGSLVCVGEGSATAETCDNTDEDCDGTVDEGVTQACGSALGLCTVGVRVCTAGAFGACSGTAAQAEACDGLDNDCDGLSDEGDPGSGGSCESDVGACQAGVEACVGGALTCTGFVGPMDESCDGLDNDCDGSTDEFINRACGTDIGECSVGSQACTAGSWGACSDDNGAPESCDGLDNDCDGSTDEGNPGSGADCGMTDVGACALGVISCVAGVPTCTGETGPVQEGCDNVDNDCDGSVDEDVTRDCGVDVGECSRGVNTCTAGVWGACSEDEDGEAESCDGLDNDCDGLSDEGNPGAGAGCQSDVGACSAGTLECIAGGLLCTDFVGPVAEACDGVDNDCDGSTDEALSRACGVDDGECSAGTEQCAAGGWGGCDAVQPASELCDGLDNDCDGLSDEGNPQSGTPCGDTDVGECAFGTQVCLAGALACRDEVGSGSERCDGLDNDCDGSTDEGLTRACGSAVGECTVGVEACGAGTWAGCDGVVAQAEACDGLDNDCDGRTDEGNPGGGVQCGATDAGECEYGQTRCIGGALACEGEVDATADTCDGLDNDCDGRLDEGDPLIDAPCGSDVGVCERGRTACVAGALSCQGGVVPSVELCDGLNNDCDERIDENNPEGNGLCGDVGACRRSGDLGDPGAPLDQPCGQCRFGREQCVDGALQCVGTVSPSDEVCDGIDNDCDYPCEVDEDGRPAGDCPADPCALDAGDSNYLDCDVLVDESVEDTDPNIGVACGVDIGECTAGAQGCVDGELVCVGGQGPIVEICDGLDNDCDGEPDDGIPVNEPCGRDIGECQTGLWACTVGALECAGATEESDEVCDGLDNDCDGRTDEGLLLGGPCGSNEGECSMGTLSCRGGREVCTNGVTPTLEVCDCADNDCDGEIDEGGDDTRCGGGGSCVMCQCALGCRDLGEFGVECPSGKAAVDVGGACYCVGQECDPAACANEELVVGGETKCAPERDDVSACICKQNECTNACNGVVCEGGQVCDPTDGRCKAQSCLLPQFRCDGDSFCNPLTGGCEDDPCADAACADGEACRDGNCFPSCAAVSCEAGELCVDGACEANSCFEVDCAGGEICNPAGGECVTPGACLAQGCPDGHVCDPVGGECVADPCLRQRCPQGEVCREARCEPRCRPDEVDCQGVCVDPSRSLQHCGASGDCGGDAAGEACAEGTVCSGGACTDSCGEGEVACGGACVDPATDAMYCGAEGSCLGIYAGQRCAEGVACVEGECEFVPGEVGGRTDVPDTTGGAAGEEAKGKFVVATGGGGCACRVAAPDGGAGQGGSGRGWLSLLPLLALWVRRRRGRAPFIHARAGATLLALLMLVWLGGCKTDAFCIDCQAEDAATDDTQSGGSDFDNSGRSDAGGGGSVWDGGVRDGGDGSGGGRDGGDRVVCIDHEICNELDDDCDGKVDEDARLDDVDVMNDPRNCGGCGMRCELDGAFAGCSAGGCVVESCDVGFLDLNGESADGCEYKCSKGADDDSQCDLRDNDCDGEIDEDIDFDSDPDNCGDCFFRCSFPHAQQGGACEARVCVLDGERCDEGFHDVNGSEADGCEYACTPSADGLDVCNARDDDCDGEVDEGADVAANDARVGAGCGSDVGECVVGTNTCVGGAIVCDGSTAITTEECDGLDNDCDGATDESDPDIGLPCGSGVGECVRGNLQCQADGGGGARLVCVGAVEALPAELCDGRDNDCDGQLDEGNPEGGLACGLLPGEQQGTCAPGLGVCAGGVLTCPGLIGPADELCDGLDNDCDGVVDEGNPEAGGSCGSGIGECEQGILLCAAGALVCDGATLPVDETCNGFDDDCDGVIDDGVGVTDAAIGIACAGDAQAQDRGECALGMTICESGTVQCDGYRGPVAELCDSLDNDCDGQTDEDDPRDGEACGSSRGACEFGALTCVGGALSCTGGTGPTVETCDGLDNDCNGAVDDGQLSDNDARVGQQCAVDQVAQDTGACDFGTSVCAGGQIQCAGYTGPSAEQCDGIDNDCDGALDEADPQLGVGCGSAVGACTQGALVCTGGALTCSGGTLGTDELCDGQDDDCDGRVDEGVTGTDPAVGQACASDAAAQDTGECDFGGTVCSAGTVQCAGYTGPSAERCDGLDNDCDGSLDESYPEAGDACGSDIGQCAQGGLVCNAGALACQGDVGSVAELCDNLDNDCDGLVDEGASVTDPQVGTSCFTDPAEDTGECVLGARVCTGGAVQCAGYVGPVSETCDGLDNDCDGAVDEDAAGVGASCGSDIGVCATGSMQCNAGALQCVGATGAQGAELCDGEDDDCDGLVDEGVSGTDPAVNVVCYDDPVRQDTGTCTAGVTICLSGGVQCSGSDGPGTESCNGLDDDCDGSSDEGNPDGGADCGRATGECSLGTLTCQGGVLVCPDDVEPVAEVCDGLDNDCNGLADDSIDSGDDPSIGAVCGDADGQCGLQRGVTACLGGAATCVGDTQPASELCDNLDNDCDGSTDEGNPGGGQACGESRGECAFGEWTCGAGSYSCVGDTGPAVEVCDGLDQDCDGAVDESVDPGDDPSIGVVCGDEDGICGLTRGATACVGGTAQCQGQQLPEIELCDGVDNDCDGSVDEAADVAANDDRVGVACGEDQGACSFGANVCQGGAIVCQGGQAAVNETCNSLDDDCDGNIDEAIATVDDPTIGVSCGDATGACVAGTTVCSAGSAACNGYVGPALEVCDLADNDCDGSSDEDFDTTSDVNNCGGCGLACPAVDNAVVECDSSACGIRNCNAGYTDKDDPGDAGDNGDDCDYMCTNSGAEVCDGGDQDCDWLVDEGLDAAPPSGFCNPNGVCAGGTVSCTGGAWTCSIVAATEVCDYLDNDCDGRVDEGFAGIGDECRSSANLPRSACTRTGTMRCDPGDDTAAPACRFMDDTLVTDDAGAAVAESCNGIDDDCDGVADEPCDDPGTNSESGSGDGSGTDSCVDDAWAELSGGVYIFSYEASRPGATNDSAGNYKTRACSTSNVLPWTNVTYPEAEAACAALGADLCDEAEWYEACANGDDVGADYCDWSHSSGAPDCAGYSSALCNGADNDTDTGTGANDSEVLPTAYIEDTGLTSSVCYRTHGGDRVYDLSGNVKEWTAERTSGGLRPLRGGAMNNTSNGISCGFDFTVVDPPGAGEPEPYFFNIGFRCCYYP